MPGSDPVVGKIEQLTNSPSSAAMAALTARTAIQAKADYLEKQAKAIMDNRKDEIEKAAAQRCYDIAMGYKAQTVAEMIRQEFNL